MISEKKLAAGILQRTGLRALLDRVLRWSGVVALGYHRIGAGTEAPFDRELWSATAEEFDAQLRFLRDNADVIRAADLDDALARRSGRHVLITFDDGYRDNYEVALPILQGRGLSATFFICTGFIDQPRAAWWDEVAWMVHTSTRGAAAARDWLPGPVPWGRNREPAIRLLAARAKTMAETERERYLDALAGATGTRRLGPADTGSLWMTWDMVRGLHAAGMEVGGHTVRHPLLGSLSPAMQEQEIAGCARRLHEELQIPMRVFSYPFGTADSFNADTVASLRARDVRWGFNLAGGCWDFSRTEERSPYNVPRVCVRDTGGLDLFRARITMPRLFA